MFDATLQALNIEVVPMEDHVQLVVVIGIVLPTPQGPAPLPSGVVRIPLSKAAAEKTYEDIKDAADNLADTPKPSDLVVANNLTGVDEAARKIKQFKG